MPRIALMGSLFALAAGLAAACTAPGTGGEGLSAQRLERELAKKDAGASDIECTDGESGWKYICRFTDPMGRRMKVGLALTGSQVSCVSAPVSEGTLLAEPRQFAEGPDGRWLADLNIARSKATSEMQAVPRPRTEAEFARYVAAISRIDREYQRDLSTLPPAPRAEDRKTFAHVRQLLAEDQRSVRLLQNALRRQDRLGIVRLLKIMGRRDAEENALFNRLGGPCA